MELFKRNIIILILFSSLFCLTTNQSKINKLSILNYSLLNNYEFQVGFGLQNNNIYTSINKMISHNLTSSFKLSKLSSSDFELFSQNSIIFNSDKRLWNFIMSINYLINELEINRWMNLGIVFNLFNNKKNIPSLGIYYDVFNINKLFNNKLNYYFHLNSKISDSYSFIIGSSFNFSEQIFNYNIEINLEI